MARTEVYHREPGESSSKVLEVRPVPLHYTSVIYNVHPSAGPGGDRQRFVKYSIQRVADTVDPEHERIIAIIDPSDSHYLRPATPVTDVRQDISYHHWVQEGDISEGVTVATLVGGNLERCLGAVGEGLMNSVKRMTENGVSARQGLEIRLPLDAIYLESGISAQVALTYLMSHARNPLEAIVALLTTPQSGNMLYPGNELFELISSYGRFSYDISLNGKKVGNDILTPQFEKEHELPTSPAEVNDITYTWMPAPLEAPLAPFKLALLGDITMMDPGICTM